MTDREKRCEDCGECKMKNEVEYSFDYKGERYTFKLTKHRPPKK